VSGNPAKLWLVLSIGGSVSASPSTMDLCLSRASFMRPTRTGTSARRPVPNPVTSGNSGSCRLRSLNLLVMKSKDSRTHLKHGDTRL
jgi:hypothetical protein